MVVRPWRAGDGAALFEAVQESLNHIRPWLPWGPLHETPESSEVFVRRWRSRWDLREDLPASVWDRDPERLVGGCGLHRIDWGARVFEIGYWLRTSATGGVPEAARLLTQLAFEKLSANRVMIRAVPENAKSVAIPQRLGFVEEGIARNAILGADGQPVDLRVFSMTPEDWCRAKPTSHSTGALLE